MLFIVCILFWFIYFTFGLFCVCMVLCCFVLCYALHFVDVVV